MLGSSTCTSWSRRGATTMKMMSSTSTTSTSGVTFMSGRTLPAVLRLRHPLTSRFPRLGLSPGLDRVRELACSGRERALVGRDRVREVVEGEDGGNRDGETERRLDERLADARRDRGQAEIGRA